jgi:threonine dehydrogenase-like Zn-dependent dehydrogenase
MQALSIDAPGRMRLVEIDGPSPAPGEVLVDVAYIGYCGSDLTSYRGLNPLVSYPRVPGHEISGTVAGLGAAETIDASSHDVIAEVRRLTGDDGPSAVIEAVGAEATFRQAIDLVGSCGRVVYIGYAKGPVSYDTKQFLLKEMDIRGSRGAQMQDFHDVIDYLKQRPEAADLIVSRVVPLAEAAAAMQQWQDDPTAFTKILVAVGGKA